MRMLACLLSRSRRAGCCNLGADFRGGDEKYSWGQTPEAAMRNIQEVVEMVIESLIEEGERIPEEPNNQAQVSDVPEVSVTV